MNGIIFTKDNGILCLPIALLGGCRLNAYFWNFVEQ